MIAKLFGCYMSRPKLSAANCGGNLQRLITDALQDSWADLTNTNTFIPMSDDEVILTWADIRPTGLSKITRCEQDAQKEIEEARRELFGTKIVDDIVNDPASWDFALQA